MSHIDATTLIRLVAGELSDERRREVALHLEACRDCRAAVDRQRSICEVLDEWRIDTDAPDQWPAIEQRLDDAQPLIIRPIWAKVGRISRIAAAIVLGVGAGHVCGRFTGPDGELTPTVQTISDSEALDAIGFSFVENPSATGLFTTVLGMENDDAEPGDAS